jgi:hypothetical protein
MNKKDVVKEDKVFPLTLKNGIVVELTTQDIIENNISKLESVVPELKFVNRVSDRNPLKKVITVLETGIQSQYKYYKYLSFFILCHIWLIQVIALINDTSAKYSMLLISFWATYAILRLQVKPYFNYNILLSFVKKVDVPFFLSSITIFLIVLSISYELLLSNGQCLTFYWNDIGKLMLFYNEDTMVYYKFLIVCCMYIAILQALYDVYSIFEKYQLDILLGVETIGVKIFKFFCMASLLYFLPYLLSDKLCNIKDGMFLWIVIPILVNYVFYVFFTNIFIGILFLIKNTTLKLH